MRRIAFMAGLLLGGSVFVFGQAGQGATPPGPDVVGSDHGVQRPGQVSRSDPQQNQRMTNRTGTTSGHERPQATAGESIYSTRTAQGNIGVKGQQGEASAISGRQRAHNRGYSSKDTSVEPMHNDHSGSQAGNSARQTSRKQHHRRSRRKTTQQASEPRQ